MQGGKITNPIKDRGEGHKPGRNNAETGITTETPVRDNTRQRTPGITSNKAGREILTFGIRGREQKMKKIKLTGY